MLAQRGFHKLGFCKPLKCIHEAFGSYQFFQAHYFALMKQQKNHQQHEQEKRLCSFGHQKMRFFQAFQMQNLRHLGHLKQQSNCTLGTLIETQCREGHLDMAMDTLAHMDSIGITPPCHVYIPLIKACMKRKSLAHAQQIHSYFMMHHPLELTSSIGEHLVLAFARCGGLEHACNLFHRLSSRTVLSWTAIISGYTERCQGSDALQMYYLMQEDCVEPNQYTYVSLLKACASIFDLEQGIQLHKEIHERGFSSNVYIRSSLVRMYGKCGSTVDAENAFKESFQVNSVLWNAMLSTYVEQGQGERVLQLYRQMRHDGVNDDDRTFAIVLQTCGNILDFSEDWYREQHLKERMLLEIGRALHCEARTKGFTSILFVANTLVSMYGKLGRVVEAENVFKGLLQQNVVSWSVMISAYVEEGQGKRALLLYKQMLGEGVKPDDHMFMIALQACETFLEEGETSEGGHIRLMALELCRALHADAEKEHLSLHTFVANTLTSVYGKCGSIADAENVFACLAERNGVSWNAMLSAYLEQGQEEKCLLLYRQMGLEGVELDERTCVIVLQASMMFTEKEEIGEVERGSSMVLFKSITKALHRDARRKGFLLDTFVCSTFVRMYGRCRLFENSESVFLSSCRTNVKVWNAMLITCLEQGQDQKVLHLYRLMQEKGVIPDQETFITAFQSCCTFAEREEPVVLEGQSMKVVALEIVKALHVEANDKGIASDVFVKNTIVSVYGKCGAVREAEAVFEELPYRNIVSWNAMLSAYVEVGKGFKALQLFRQMHEEGVNTNEVTCMAALQACGLLVVKEDTPLENDSIKLTALQIGRALHAKVSKKGLSFKNFVGNTLVSLYGKCGSIKDAQNIFANLSCRDVVSWSAMLSAYVEQGHWEGALQLYSYMQKEGITPDDRTFVVALKACGSFMEDGGLSRLRFLEIGQALHTDGLMWGYTSNVSVCNMLVRMYGKCGCILEAKSVFYGLPKCNAVSWNTMLSALVEQNQDEKALLLYKEMQEAHVKPDKRTIVNVLQACIASAENEQTVVVDNQSIKVVSLSICRALHDVALKEEFAVDTSVGSTLVSTYGTCGCISEAENLFDRLPQCELVSWNAMLLAYVEQGLLDKALQLHKSRMTKRVPFDDNAFFYSLQAGSDLGSLEACRHLHFTIVSSGYDIMPSVETSLAYAYGGCASIADAKSICDGLVEPDVVVWTACISGYVREGDSITGLQIVEAMQLEGVSPNRVTFLSVFSACNHAGLVDIGLLYYEAMSKDYGIAPDLKHNAAMVELLGRAGYFTGVEKLMQSMSMEADLAIWLCLLGACLTHGNAEMGELAFRHAVHSHPEQAAAYVLMSNIYADSGG